MEDENKKPVESDTKESEPETKDNEED